MSSNKTYTVKVRRKRERKTNYRKRVKYISSGKTRIVLRVSNKNLKIQAINFGEKGDICIGGVNSLDLKSLGWNAPTGNLYSSYLTGLLFGSKLKSKIKEGIIDTGLRTVRKNTRLSAAIKGISDSGIDIPFSEEISPSENKLNGELTAQYSKKLKLENENKFKSQFSKYLKDGVNPEEIPNLFEKTRKKLIGA